MTKAYSYCIRIAPDAPPVLDIVLCDSREAAIEQGWALLNTMPAARSVEVADGEGWRLVCDRPANDGEPWRDGLWA